MVSINHSTIRIPLITGKYGRVAIVIIAFASLLRVLLIGKGYLATNSDESTMGLMALHIAYRGEHPTFFYGQNYMGSFSLLATTFAGQIAPQWRALSALCF